MTAQQIIRKHYGDSKNFMTPTVIKYGKVGKQLAYEISRGTGMSNNEIVGVTFAHETEGRKHDISKLFDTVLQAELYITELKHKQ